MKNHNKFILSPISDILKDTILSTKTIKNGINTYPLSEYILQSTFIKMTGAQEQKMKCIMWELSNNNYEFRYSFLSGKYANCQYSSYEDKKYVYTQLINQISELDRSFQTLKEEERKKILEKSGIEEYTKNTNLIKLAQKDYMYYLKFWRNIKNNHFANEKTILLNPDLKKIYDNNLYKARNRIAHNTRSYQHNLPTLNILTQPEYSKENYFIWFSILILIDNVFVSLYEIYLDTLEKRHFF